MAKPSKFAHVVYQTRRFDEMVEWYQKVFEVRFMTWKCSATKAA